MIVFLVIVVGIISLVLAVLAVKIYLFIFDNSLSCFDLFVSSPLSLFISKTLASILTFCVVGFLSFTLLLGGACEKFGVHTKKDKESTDVSQPINPTDEKETVKTTHLRKHKKMKADNKEKETTQQEVDKTDEEKSSTTESESGEEKTGFHLEDAPADANQ